MLMTTRTFRAVRSVGTLLVGGAVLAATSSCALAGNRPMATHCALLSDSIGIYVGNAVTQMGYPIGEITAITAENTHVRIDFSLTEQRTLPVDVKAVLRSPSILADRSLELAGNYAGGPQLESAQCIPLEHSVTPKSLSEVIGSADTFVNAISPPGSTNLADTVRGLDRLASNNGAAVGQLLTRSSELLGSPDAAIADIGSIVHNTAELSTALVGMRGTLAQVVEEGPEAFTHVAGALEGGRRFAGEGGLGTIGPLTEMVGALETQLGSETQLTLDSASAALRKLSPHANAFAGLFDPVPWWINSVAQHYNNNPLGIFDIGYRPPLFRVPTHDGLAMCGFMNAQMPGSCADVHGIPYAVDVSLLQYVLMEANRR